MKLGGIFIQYKVQYNNDAINIYFIKNNIMNDKNNTCYNHILFYHRQRENKRYAYTVRPSDASIFFC